MSLIPITIFTTLVASLFVSLTGTPTIFFLTNEDKKTYKKDSDNEKYLASNQKLILEADRE
jgi:multidrug efflux pump subunit AcrB